MHIYRNVYVLYVLCIHTQKNECKYGWHLILLLMRCLPSEERAPPGISYPSRVLYYDYVIYMYTHLIYHDCIHASFCTCALHYHLTSSHGIIMIHTYWHTRAHTLKMFERKHGVPCSLYVGSCVSVSVPFVVLLLVVWSDCRYWSFLYQQQHEQQQH